MSVTQQLLETAATRGDDDALVGSNAGRRHTYDSLASTLMRAAAGLAWRGLRPRDVVGVYVPDAACYVLACHAIRAAGGVPCPVSPDLSVAEVAGQLADCGARMLITAQPLAAAGACGVPERRQERLRLRRAAARPGRGPAQRV